MHSLGDVWHLGSEDLESLQVLGPCRIWRIWSGATVSLAALFLPIFMHSLGQSLGPLGVHSVTLQGSGVSAGSGSLPAGSIFMHLLLSS